jgi:hypothetical protein
MNKLVVGVIPPGAQNGLEKHMEIWVIESGMEAELATIKLGTNDTIKSDLDAKGDKVLGLLVPIKLVSPEQIEALEALAKTRNISFYRLH